MKKVRYKSEEAQTAGENDELIFLPELLEKFLLVFLADVSWILCRIMGTCGTVPKEVTASRVADHRSRKTSAAVMFVVLGGEL